MRHDPDEENVFGSHSVFYLKRDGDVSHSLHRKQSCIVGPQARRSGLIPLWQSTTPESPVSSSLLIPYFFPLLCLSPTNTSSILRIFTECLLDRHNFSFKYKKSASLLLDPLLNSCSYREL